MNEREKARVLHEQAVEAVAMNKKSEKSLVVIFYELDTFGGYRFYGAKSLYDYAMKIHKLSEPTALNIINVARKSKQVPELRHAVVEGKLSVATARKIVPVITKDNKDHWIELAMTETKVVLERAVATEKPNLAVRETAKYVSGDRLAVTSIMKVVDHEKLKRVMDIESQRTRKNVGQGEAIVAGLDAYLEIFCPIKKAERSKIRAQKKESAVNAPAPVPGQVINQRASIRTHLRQNSSLRSTLPAVLKHALDMRDCRQCTQLDENDVRCEERRWLDYHHIIERSKGGQDTFENLTTVCSAHHRMIHDKMIALKTKPASATQDFFAGREKVSPHMDGQLTH
ncbi:MAG: HNH endonuclease signature motif containing protein [Bdellovibrionota bacterium]